MGGIGSGNRWQWGAGPTVESYRKIDVRRWAREGYLQPGLRFGWKWSVYGEKTGSITVQAERGRVILDYRVRESGDEWESLQYAVQLTTTDCNLGGYRQWFLCPASGCGRRVACLYGGRIFACRHCHRLSYSSQREDASDRAGRRADRIRAKLEWEPGFLNGPGDKPKGMHWRTFERLCVEHDAWAERSTALMMEKLLVLTGRL